MKHFVLDARNGQYIPQQVYSMFKDNPFWDWSKVSKEAVASVDNGPEDEYYWESWEEILNNVTIKLDSYTSFQEGVTRQDDHTYFLTQDEDGNVWIKSVS